MVTEIDSVLEELNLAECVGVVCMMWRDIECQINDLIHSLSTLLDPNLADDWPNHLIAIFLPQMDIRSKISTAKAIAHEANRKDSPKLYKKTAKLLNYIDNDLRVSRNRYVHDQWIPLIGENYIREQEKITIASIQSHKTGLSFSKMYKFSKKEVNSILLLMQDCKIDLEKLIEHTRGLYYKRWQNAKHAPQLPVHWSYSIRLKTLALEKP